jgi:hypothetical protein
MESKEGIIYILSHVIGGKKKGVFRVGRSKNMDLSRPKSQQAYLPFQTALFVFYSKDHYNLETTLHRELVNSKVNGDWYKQDVFPVIDRILKDPSIFKIDFPTPTSFFNTLILNKEDGI